MKGVSAFILWTAERPEPLLNQLSKRVEVACLEALPSCGTALLKIDGKDFRALRKSEGKYSVIAVSSDRDRVNSKKRIELEANIILAAAPTIDSASQRAEMRTRRLLHNLKSLTAKTLQEIFFIAQQDKLVGNPRDAIPYLESEIKNNVDGAARALLEILKHQAAQKAEYTAFDRLSGKLESRSVEKHEIHRVLMNVLYLFFGEFLAKKVRAEVERTRLHAVFDYDSIHVCVYYLLENAVKYVRPGYELTVTANDDGNGFINVRFSMESLVISSEEEERIFFEGCSGRHAIEEKLNGAGIGLYLARMMAQLNGGALSVIAGRPRAGSQYARNVFVLTLPSK